MEDVDVLEFLKGKKTYLTVIVTITLAVLDALGVWSMPPEGWTIVGALGLGFLRSGTKKIEEGIKETAEGLGKAKGSTTDNN